MTLRLTPRRNIQPYALPTLPHLFHDRSDCRPTVCVCRR